MTNREILEYLESDFTVVTPTNGLAHHLQTEYAVQQIARGRQSWPTVKILSWYAWCHVLWQDWSFEVTGQPVLLTNTQSLSLWRKVIASSKYSKQLLQIQATAKQVQSADKLFNDWCMEDISEEYYLNQDAFAFKIWKESYELQLRAKHWIDESRLLPHLIQHFESNRKEKVLMYAFDEWKPVQSSWFNHLSEQGFTVDFLDSPDQNNSTKVLEFQNESDELTALGQWVINCHKKDPQATIGIVVPNLASKQTTLQFFLEKTLSIKKYLSFRTQNDLPFSIALGKPLTDYPLVQIALNFLSLNHFYINVDRFSLLLRSVFISGYKKEASQRHVFDKHIRDLKQQEIKFETVINLHDQLDESCQCPEFISALTEFNKLQQETSGTKSFNEWMQIINNLLNSFSWPGDRELNSDEYQSIEAWQKCLDEFSLLDNVLAPVEWREAVNCLQSICFETNFQPQTANKKIQVLGVAGANGVGFDYCWFLNLSDGNWPMEQSINPFIPVKFQKEYGVTSTLPQKQINLVKNITRRLVQSTKEIVLSYPVKDDDQLLRPSPVLREYTIHVNEKPDFKTYSKKLIQSKKTEEIIDTTAPAINSDIPVNGGVSLFKDQAACPFKAFAKHRLHARGIEKSDIGLDAIDRGNLVHRVLHIFWQGMKKSEQLRRSTESVVNKRIEEAVKVAISEQSKKMPETFGQNFITIESDRLQNLVHEWLLIESKREPFNVKATEKGHHVLFQNITLHIRLDRIDELPDGRLVIIDYKTGSASVSSWFGERPEDPQLPLYAITSEGEVAALVFAKIKKGESRFIGQSYLDSSIPEVTYVENDEWHQFIHDWKENLGDLANEFRQGQAIVDPTPSACKFCDLPMLCRIAERIEQFEDDQI